MRPRYRRITAALGAVATTLVAVLGAMGWLPSPAEPSTRPVAAPVLAHVTKASQPDSPADSPAERAGGAGAAASAGPADELAGSADGAMSLAGAETDLRADHGTTIPADSGQGRRIVFDMSAQRVWLVDVSASGADRVRRTYLVSGSVSDNLHPGTYAVYSRSRHAWGIDDSGTMEYFVRFTHGKNAAIGFHDIPVKDGRRLQTRAELGTPQSHGCIRQWRPDAKALWRFAPVGTTVVVVA